jgi:hypothetical protein
MDIKLIIFSACHFKKKIFTNTPLAAFSNYLAQRHGYKTVLYTDSINYEQFKNIKYDEFVFLDEKIIEQFPNRGWCLGKLLAMSMVKEPFIHIDFDLLLVNNLPNYIKTNECFAFHNEPYMKELFKPPGVHKLYKKYKFQNELNYNETESNNCAIIGGQNYQLINESCEKVIDYAITNRKFFDKFGNLFKTQKTRIYIPVFFEQIFLLNIIREKTLSKTIPTIIQEETLETISTKADELKIMHLWGGKLKFLPQFQKIVERKNISF